MLSINESGTGSDNSDGETTSQIGQANHKAGAEESVSLSLSVVERRKMSSTILFNSRLSYEIIVPAPGLWSANHKDADNDTVESDGLAENYTVRKGMVRIICNKKLIKRLFSIKNDELNGILLTILSFNL